MVTRVYLIRHAHAEGNEKRFFQGCLDTDLSEKGNSQLLELSQKFNGIKLDAIFSSDLLRAKKTAEATAKGAGFKGEISFLKELREMSFGSLEGTLIADFYGNPDHKKESDLWDNCPEKFFCQGGETMEEVFERVTSSLTSIISNNIGKNIAIVSHGCALRNICAFLLGGKIEFLKFTPWIKHANFAYFEIDEIGNVILKFC